MPYLCLIYLIPIWLMTTNKPKEKKMSVMNEIGKTLKTPEQVLQEKTMTNQELKKKVIEDMKQDNDLKKYVKDFEDLSTKQFDSLVKSINKAYLKVKNK